MRIIRRKISIDTTWMNASWSGVRSTNCTRRSPIKYETCVYISGGIPRGNHPSQAELPAKHHAVFGACTQILKFIYTHIFKVCSVVFFQVVLMCVYISGGVCVCVFSIRLLAISWEVTLLGGRSVCFVFVFWHISASSFVSSWSPDFRRYTSRESSEPS
jgi:hypothetical protein